MAKNIKSIIEDLVKDTITEMNYEYVETDYSKQGKDYVLTVYIDSPDGIDLDDCEKVSRTIEKIIDDADPIEDSYCLCVSSVGLDKPLKTDRDFEKNTGNCVDIKLYKNLNGKKEFSGRLISFNDNFLVIDMEENSSMEISRKDIAKIVRHIDF